MYIYTLNFPDDYFRGLVTLQDYIKLSRNNTNSNYFTIDELEKFILNCLIELNLRFDDSIDIENHDMYISTNVIFNSVSNPIFCINDKVSKKSYVVTETRLSILYEIEGCLLPFINNKYILPAVAKSMKIANKLFAMTADKPKIETAHFEQPKFQPSSNDKFCIDNFERLM